MHTNDRIYLTVHMIWCQSLRKADAWWGDLIRDIVIVMSPGPVQLRKLRYLRKVPKLHTVVHGTLQQVPRCTFVSDAKYQGLCVIHAGQNASCFTHVSWRTHLVADFRLECHGHANDHHEAAD